MRTTPLPPTDRPGYHAIANTRHHTPCNANYPDASRCRPGDRALELFGGRLSWLVDSFPPQSLPHRDGYDLEIQPQRLPVYVPHVERELLLPGQGVTTVHLSPAGNTGLRVVATHLLRRVTLQVLHQ